MTTMTAALYDCLGSADARFLALCSGTSDDSAHDVLALLDAFFQRATQLQTHREQLQALSRDATSALNEETRLVFLVYMRVLALLRKHASDAGLQLLDSVLHVTRVAPFCQLYARNNASSVAQLVSALVDHVDGFAARIDTLRGVYLDVRTAFVAAGCQILVSSRRLPVSSTCTSSTRPCSKTSAATCSS